MTETTTRRSAREALDAQVRRQLMYSGGAWRHVTPCRLDDLRRLPLDDAEFVTLDAR